MLCFRGLTDYLYLLADWKVRYAPKTPDDRFVLYELMKDGKLTFLQDYTARKKKEDMSYGRRKDADLSPLSVRRGFGLSTFF